MPKILLSFKRLCLIHLLLTVLICFWAAVFGSLSLTASIAVGALVMLTSVVTMAWSTWRLMTQKTFALTAGIIVIKYAVLLGSLYYLSTTDWLRPLGVVAGVFSFMIAALIYAALEHKQKETNQIE